MVFIWIKISPTQGKIENFVCTELNIWVYDHVRFNYEALDWLTVVLKMDGEMQCN